VMQFQLGLCSARREGRDTEPLQHDRVSEVERADFRLHFQLHPVTVEHRRREVQADAELFELHRDARVETAALQNRNRKFAAGEKARFLAALGNQVRFRETLKQATRLQRLHDEADVVLFVEQKQVEKVTERELALRARHWRTEVSAGFRGLKLIEAGRG